MSASQVKNYTQFYKLIIPSILQQKKLRIPKKFAKKFGHELYGFATLTVPDDRMWLVTISEIDQKLWFCNGWHEFVEHYSICFGHFLFFQYEGNSNFSVYMYVLQPYKIKDPRTATTTVKDKQHNVLDEMEDDDFVEISGYTSIASDPSKHNIFDVGRNSFSRDKLKDCINGLDEVSQNPSGGSVNSTLPLQYARRGIKRDELRDSEDDVRLQFLDIVTQKIENTTQKKQRINEENLHSSAAADIAQRPTRSTQDVGVQSNSMDHKKIDLSEQHRGTLDKIEAETSRVFKTGGGRTKSLTTEERKREKIVANEFKPVNPFCRVVLREQHRGTLDKIEAETSRVFKTAGGRTKSLTTEERKRAKIAANEFKPVNPFCRVVLRPSYLFKGCSIYLPSCFAKKHLSEVSGKIKLQFSDGKQWPVRCAYRDGTTRLSKGWYEFSAWNGLEEGDVCVFELLNSKDIVLKVTVFRAVEDSEFMNRD